MAALRSGEPFGSVESFWFRWQVLDDDVAALRDVWEATGFELERLQRSPLCVAQEQEGLAARRGPAYRLTFELTEGVAAAATAGTAGAAAGAAEADARSTAGAAARVGGATEGAAETAATSRSTAEISARSTAGAEGAATVNVPATAAAAPAALPAPAGDRHKVAVLRQEGSNGDREMCAAFHAAGLEAWDLTVSDLVEGTARGESRAGQGRAGPGPGSALGLGS